MVTEPGTTVELKVTRLVGRGEGLAELDGLKVFVPFSAPEERVRGRIVLRKRDYAVARIEEVIEPSPLRVNPECPFYGECGGCQLQHLSYPGQLVVKKLMVNDALQHLGGIFLPVRNIPPGADPWRYRNKTQYPVADQNGLRVGFFRPGSHRLLDVGSCLLHPVEFDRLRAAAIEGMTQARETAYDETRQRGNVRHLVFRRARGSGQMLALVVTRTPRIGRQLLDRLAAEPGVVGVVQSVHDKPGSRILGRDFVPLVGQDFLIETVLGRQFRVSAGSFFQVNVPQAEELVRKVLKHLAPTGGETVIDLYSGVGMLALLIAPFVRAITGVEIAPAAVADARFNAGAFGGSNADFVCQDVEPALPRFTKADAVIVDPPRKGCPAAVIRRVCDLRPARVVYVSCNPATLARDLSLFEKAGYATSEVEPVDMFPQTFHVEVVARLLPT